MDSLKCDTCSQTQQDTVVADAQASLTKANEAAEHLNTVYVYCLDCKLYICKGCDTTSHFFDHGSPAAPTLASPPTASQDSSKKDEEAKARQAPRAEANERQDYAGQHGKRSLGSKGHQRILICMECEKNFSDSICKECRQSLCDHCWLKIHNKGARKHHQKSAPQIPKIYHPNEMRKNSSSSGSHLNGQEGRSAHESVLDEGIDDLGKAQMLQGIQVSLANSQGPLNNLVPAGQGLQHQLGPSTLRAAPFMPARGPNFIPQPSLRHKFMPPQVPSFNQQMGHRGPYASNMNVPMGHHQSTHPSQASYMYPQGQVHSKQMSVNQPMYYQNAKDLQRGQQMGHDLGAFMYRGLHHPETVLMQNVMQQEGQLMPGQYGSPSFNPDHAMVRYPMQMVGTSSITQPPPAGLALQQQNSNSQNTNRSERTKSEDETLSLSIQDEPRIQQPSAISDINPSDGDLHAAYRKNTGEMRKRQSQFPQWPTSEGFMESGAIHTYNMQPYQTPASRKEQGQSEYFQSPDVQGAGVSSSGPQNHALNHKFLTPPFPGQNQSRANQQNLARVSSSAGHSGLPPSAAMYLGGAKQKPQKMPVGHNHQSSAAKAGAGMGYAAKPPIASQLEKKVLHLNQQTRVGKRQSDLGVGKETEEGQLSHPSTGRWKKQRSRSPSVDSRQTHNSKQSRYSRQKGQFAKEAGAAQRGRNGKLNELQESPYDQGYAQREKQSKKSGNAKDGQSSTSSKSSNTLCNSQRQHKTIVATYVTKKQQDVLHAQQARHVPVLQPAVSLYEVGMAPQSASAPAIPEQQLMERMQRMLFAEAGSGDLLLLKSKLVDKIASEFFLKNEDALAAINRAVSYDIIHQTDRNFAKHLKFEFISLKIKVLSHQCLQWVITSLRRDEMTPTKNAIKNRVKEAFDYKLSNENWDAIVKSIQKANKNLSSNSSTEAQHMSQVLSSQHSSKQRYRIISQSATASDLQRKEEVDSDHIRVPGFPNDDLIIAMPDRGSSSHAAPSTKTHQSNRSSAQSAQQSNATLSATGFTRIVRNHADGEGVSGSTLRSQNQIIASQEAIQIDSYRNQAEAGESPTKTESSKLAGSSGNTAQQSQRNQSNSSQQRQTAPKFKIVQLCQSDDQESENSGQSLGTAGLHQMSSQSVYAIYMEDEEVWCGVDIENSEDIDLTLYEIMKNFLQEYFCSEDAFQGAAKQPDEEVVGVAKRSRKLSESTSLELANLRMIPGGRYGCTQFLKMCGPAEIRQCSVGKTTQMVQLAIKEDVLRHLKTQIVWSTQVDRHKTEQNHAEKMLQHAKREKVKEAILSILAESSTGMSLAQLPQYLKNKLPFELDWNELGFPKLQDLLKSMEDQIKVELRDASHPFAYMVNKQQKSGQSVHLKSHSKSFVGKTIYREENLSEQICQRSHRQMIFDDEKMTRIIKAVFDLLILEPLGVHSSALLNKIKKQVAFEFTLADLGCRSILEFYQKYIRTKDDAVEIIVTGPNGFQLRSQRQFNRIVYYGHHETIRMQSGGQQAHSHYMYNQKPFPGMNDYYPDNANAFHYQSNPQVQPKPLDDASKFFPGIPAISQTEVADCEDVKSLQDQVFGIPSMPSHNVHFSKSRQEDQMQKMHTPQTGQFSMGFNNSSVWSAPPHHAHMQSMIATHDGVKASYSGFFDQCLPHTGQQTYAEQHPQFMQMYSTLNVAVDQLAQEEPEQQELIYKESSPRWHGMITELLDDQDQDYEGQSQTQENTQREAASVESVPMNQSIKEVNQVPASESDQQKMNMSADSLVPKAHAESAQQAQKKLNYDDKRSIQSWNALKRRKANLGGARPGQAYSALRQQHENDQRITEEASGSHHSTRSPEINI